VGTSAAVGFRKLQAVGNGGIGLTKKDQTEAGAMLC
jgi:hypothetical protein